MKKHYFDELSNDIVSRQTPVDMSTIPQQPVALIECNPPTSQATLNAIEQLKAHRAVGTCSVLAESLKWGGNGNKQVAASDDCCCVGSRHGPR